MVLLEPKSFKDSSFAPTHTTKLWNTFLHSRHSGQRKRCAMSHFKLTMASRKTAAVSTSHHLRRDQCGPHSVMQAFYIRLVRFWIKEAYGASPCLKKRMACLSKGLIVAASSRSTVVMTFECAMTSS